MYDPGLAFDLDYGDVRAERIDPLRRVEKLGRLQPRTDVVRQTPGIGAPGNVAQRQTTSRHAAYLVLTVVEHNIFWRGFQDMRGDLLCFGAHLTRRLHERAPADHQPTAAKCANAHRPGRRVAVPHHDPVKVGPDLVGHDLGEGCF